MKEVKYPDRSGRNNSFYGRKHTKESIKKMSRIKLGKTLSSEHKRNIGIASLGHKGPTFQHTEEAKKKISQSAKRMWATIDKIELFQKEIKQIAP